MEELEKFMNEQIKKLKQIKISFNTEDCLKNNKIIEN